jgi:hypothetical protein
LATGAMASIYCLLIRSKFNRLPDNWWSNFFRSLTSYTGIETIKISDTMPLKPYVIEQQS